MDGSPVTRPWKPSFQPNAGSFLVYGYRGATEDYVTHMMMTCTLGSVRPVKRVVCGIPVFVAMREAMFHPPAGADQSRWLAELMALNAATELPFMGARVTWDRDVRDGTMIFFDSEDYVIPQDLTWHPDGPYPPGALGWITGFDC